MRKLLGNKRAVSPVVSTVLMILVVMVGMSMLFAFFVNYTRDFQTGSGSAVLESLVIEDVSSSPGGGQVWVWVYNVGKVSFTVTSVYVNDQFDGNPNLEIAPGQHGMITISASSGGMSVLIKIVTARGSAFEGRYSW
jgi:flagellin-like protein